MHKNVRCKAGSNADNGDAAAPGGPRNASVADDPDEVDISNPSSFAATPNSRQTAPPNNPLAQAMMQMEQERRAKGESEGQDDPMMKMMQQMMGSMGGDPNDPNAKQPEVPPWMASLLKGGGGQQQDQTKEPETSSAYLWRVVHALFAFILAFYICLTSTFNGSKLARNQSVYTEEAGYGLGPRLFVIFTSAELVLQSTRYFLEKGQLQGGGPLAKIANSGFVPEPYANYIRIGGRYIGIAQTLFKDMMCIIFVMGAMAWWNGVDTTA